MDWSDLIIWGREGQDNETRGELNSFCWLWRGRNRATSQYVWQPLEAKKSSQLTVNKKLGTSVLQLQGPEFQQKPNGQETFSPLQLPERTADYYVTQVLKLKKIIIKFR